ncbi:hypothetical protein LTR62_004581 [Meristemomyces frigidus]|uniref:Uncharacterized protein n=1 Tax=Meristemomyces frigidus TaxID=1508187 RepID=A0AAN7TEM8_9PEZI|nr:hypothetical protein LTR62_004581 [Meristemomyces frigidus]
MTSSPAPEIFDPDITDLSADFGFATPPRAVSKQYAAWQCNLCLVLQLHRDTQTAEPPSTCPTCGSSDIKRCVMQLSDEGCGPHPDNNEGSNAFFGHGKLSNTEESWVEDAYGGFVTRDSLNSPRDSVVGEETLEFTRASPVRPSSASASATTARPQLESSSRPSARYRKKASEAFELWDDAMVGEGLSEGSFKDSEHDEQVEHKEVDELLNDLDSTLLRRMQIVDWIDTESSKENLDPDNRDLTFGDDTVAATLTVARKLTLPQFPTRTQSATMSNSSSLASVKLDKGKSRATTSKDQKQTLDISSQTIKDALLTVPVGTAGPSRKSPPKRMASTQATPSIIKRLETALESREILQRHLKQEVERRKYLVDEVRLLVAQVSILEAQCAGPLDHSPTRATVSVPKADDPWQCTVRANALSACLHALRRSSVECERAGEKSMFSSLSVLPRKMQFEALGDGEWYVMKRVPTG